MQAQMRESPQRSTIAGDRPPALRRFTVDEYHRMIASGIVGEDDPVELLEGWIVEMSPHGPDHRVAIHLVLDAVEPLLKSGWNAEVQVPLSAVDSEPAPDLSVVRGPRRRYLDHHPTGAEVALVVEVADTSLPEDRRRKGRVYATAGIAWYWIVNLAERQVEVYSEAAETEPAGVKMYRQRKDYREGQHVPLAIEGQTVGSIAVAELLP